MVEYGMINYLSDTGTLLQKIQSQSCDILIVNKIHSVSSALELATSLELNVKITGSIFKINESFLENPNLNVFNKSRAILLTFQSVVSENKSSVIFWKNAEQENFYSLKILNDPSGHITEYIQEFLVREIQEGRSGILNDGLNHTVIELPQIGNKHGYNLLMLAARDNRDDIIKQLLLYGLDIDYENRDGLNAIKCAWTNYINNIEDPLISEKSNKIILILLNANSKFPKDFDFKIASEEFQEFLLMCENLHSLVAKEKFEEVRIVRDKYPNLFYFYDRENKSLLAYSISNGKQKVLDHLSSGINIGCHEDFEEICEEVPGTETRALRDKFKVFAKELPEVHLFVLRSKCKIGYNDRNSHERWKYIEEAFRVIDSNEKCSKILKVAATFKKLKIYFDFLQDTVYYLDPTKSMYTAGTVYSTGVVYIGAKFLTDEEKKFEVFGVIIHELCHLAMNITYMNDFNPYPMGESLEKILFENQVVSECKKFKRYEDMVENVFENYYVEHQHSELIVTVPQMLMQYFVRNRRAKWYNTFKISRCQKHFKALFKYFEIIVEPELEEALTVLKLLYDKENDIKFDELTDPMKAKVLHSEIIFQDEKTSFFEVIGNDSEILKLLTSQQIRTILVTDNPIEIGNPCNVTIKHKIVERKFVIQNFKNFKIDERKNLLIFECHAPIQVESDLEQIVNDGQADVRIIPWHVTFNIKPEDLDKVKDFSIIMEETRESKIFVLADYAGAGKTTTFKKLTEKLKQHYKNYWVSFINLRKHIDVFEIHQKNNTNIKNIPNLLFEVMAENSDLEKKIFYKLLKENKVILLVDGIDEISPKYNQFLVNILKMLRYNTENQLWISTRPQHAQQMAELFGILIHNFIPFAPEERRESVVETLKTFGISDEKVLSKALQDFEKFFHTIEVRSNGQFHINNPLLVGIFSELYSEGEIDIGLTSLGGIYEKTIDRQKRKTDVKIAINDRDPFEDFSLKKVHQIFAIKLLITEDSEKNYGINLDELVIFREWKKRKQNFTSEKIQRYGFLTVDIRDDNSSIDFIHRTYAEFFLADFIICFVYKSDEGTKDEEFEKIFKIIELIDGELSEFIIVRNFITSYIRSELAAKRSPVHPKIFELISAKFPKSSKFPFEFKTIQSLEFWSTFFIHETENLRKLWLVNDNEDLLKKTFFHFKNSWTIDDNLTKNIFSYKTFKNYYNSSTPSEKVKINNSVSCLEGIISVVENIFGKDWHQDFNKSEHKLITHTELESYKDHKSYSAFNINLLKLLDLMEKNYRPRERICVHKSYLNMVLVRNDIPRHVYLSIICNIFRHIPYNFEEILVEVFLAQIRTSIIGVLIEVLEGEKYWHCDIEFGFLKYLGEKVEVLLNKNRSDIIVLLCCSYRTNTHLLVRALQSNDVKTFVLYKNLCKKYSKSWQGIYFQKIFGNHFQLSANSTRLTEKMFKELEKLFKEIFTSNVLLHAIESDDMKTFKAFLHFYRQFSNILPESDLLDVFVEQFHPDVGNVDTSSKTYTALKDFMHEIFQHDQNKFLKIKESCKFFSMMFENIPFDERKERWCEFNRSVMFSGIYDELVAELVEHEYEL